MGKKVLVVDDDFHFSSFAKRILEDQTWEVSVASSGAEGLDKARQERPDLILLDLGMPDLDGLEVLRRLKDDARTQAIPVVLCSISRGPQTLQKGLSLGAADYIPKPLSPKTSIPIIKGLLGA